MDSIKIDKKQTKMIAHRGLSGLAQENTTLAFMLAAFRSYFGIETDVHVTKDHKYLICHDDNILRVSGVDMIIEESNYNELRKIPVLNKDGSFSNELFLPSLEEYITICKDYNKVAVLELKNPMNEEDIVNIVKIVIDLGHYDDTIFISFEECNINYCKKNFYDINCQFLTDISTEEKLNRALEIATKYNVDLDLHYGFIDQKFVDVCKEKNIKLNVWTVDEKEKAEELIDMGVDFITSNILE